LVAARKRLEIKAAENARILFRFTDARGEVLAFHGIGYRDEMRRDFACAPFGELE
jgi:hypothetical protein